MIKVSPISSSSYPSSHESSALRPARDSDSPMTLWKKQNKSNAQSYSDQQAVQNLAREVAKLRRRILGGSGGASTETWPPVVYDKSKSWAVGAWVWVKPSDAAVIDGAIDADTGLTVYATSGHWRCRKAASPTTIDVGGAPTTAYHMPILPYPNADDATASNVYWVFISGQATCP